jgi:hypothetical protein
VIGLNRRLNRLEIFLIITTIILVFVIFITVPISKYDINEDTNNSTDKKNNSSDKNIQKERKVMNIPTQYEKSSNDYGLEFSFTRELDNRVFNYTSHDPISIKTNGTNYLIVATDGKQKLYNTDTPKNQSSWNLIDGNYVFPLFELDDIVIGKNKSIIYSDSTIYVSNSSIKKDNWRTRSSNDFDDVGAYYDEDQDEYHLYYEKGNKSEFSGQSIGHAVSKNGLNDWKIYPEVWNGSNTDYGVGDFNVIEIEDKILIFGDYNKKHPKYNVAIWSNNNPYTNFEKIDEFAMTPRKSDGEYTDNYGVGDPDILRTNKDEYIMFTNGHSNSSDKSILQSYNGTIKID